MKSNDVLALIILGYAAAGILVGLAIMRLAHYIRHKRDSALTLTTKSGSDDEIPASESESSQSSSSRPIAMPVPGPLPGPPARGGLSYWTIRFEDWLTSDFFAPLEEDIEIKKKRGGKS
ncbi:hypothetical protein B0T21DRAFT_348204 [Apiosordaria backusii]|uniref:Uncharacterized protein n=1 Tax=Apiosordaria backusii TaxID=314023 RepID=A0AA40BKZ2_9PEZI|nr:hypothetical protein B0T21DRAFT_348204 [Apiosordaria backusii]